MFETSNNLSPISVSCVVDILYEVVICDMNLE